MDRSLDEVRFLILSATKHSHLKLFYSLQIVAASRTSRQPKRGAVRRATARAQVLGTTGTSPAAKARIANTTKAAGAAPQPVEKIVVSNLPADVNEAQVKVRLVSLMFLLEYDLTLLFLYRSFSKLPLVLCVRSICTMTQMAAPRASPRSFSRNEGMATRHISSITTASSMGVSIRHFLSFEFVF